MHAEPPSPALDLPRDRSFLRAHLRWVLAITLVAGAVALALSWYFEKPVYESEVRILVNPIVSQAGTPFAPDMETESEVAVSGVVTADAAQRSGISRESLQRDTDVSVPAASTVLILKYAAETAEQAQHGTQAMADAYVAYRKAQATPLNDAVLPAIPQGTNYPVNAAAGLTLGLLVGVGSALLRDRSDDRLRGPRDLVDQTGLPVLATVPVRRRSSRRWPALVVLHVPDSRAAEAYRQVAGKIERAARRRRNGTTVTLITGSAPADGAAVVAANTALALARSGEQVLLLEGDVHSPRLAALFDLPVGGGASEVLAGPVPLPGAVRAGRVGGLWLLPAGVDACLTPGALVSHRAVGRLLGQVAADIDHVIVLAPPAVDAAETATLAEHAHLLVVVAMTGRTARQDLRSAVAELLEAPGTILGGVLLQTGRAGGSRGRPARGTTAPRPVRAGDEVDARPAGAGDGEDVPGRPGVAATSASPGLFRSARGGRV